MSAQKQLKATARPRAGKGAARAARREGQVPAVIYGGNEPPLTITLNAHDIEKTIYAGHFLSTVFTIDVDGKSNRVIPRDYQLDRIKDKPLHVDFLRIVAGSKIRVDVPVHFKNNEASPGLKAGGALNVVAHTIELLCPPDEIPQEIMVDLTGLEIGDSLHIGDLKLPANVALRDKSNFTVVTIAAPTKEIEVVPVAAAAAPAAGADAAKTDAAKKPEGDKK